MIDQIIFNHPYEALWFGEKIKMVVGAITASKSIQAQIYSFPPKSYGLIEEPAKYEIFLVPITLAKYVVCAPNEIHFMDHVDFYLFLEQEKR